MADREIRLIDLIVLCRRIRQGFYDKCRYEDAGKMFITEMELQRNFEDVET